MKYLKRGLLISFLAFSVLLIVGSVFMLDFSLKSNVKPTDEADAYAYLFKHEYLRQWVDSLRSAHALRDTFIVASDGTKLHAMYIQSPSPHFDKSALVIHGYTNNSIRMLMIGYLYNKGMGYNVLLPDLRAHGKSEGKYIQMGWKDRLDILRWIDVVKSRFGDSTKVVIHGISMGAATTMMTSGAKLQGNVKCFVEDCGYTSVWDEFAYKLKKEYHLPAFPLLYTTSFYANLKLGWNFKEASPLDQIKKCKLPMFFIHGGDDTYVPTSMVYKLYEAKKGIKRIWVIPGVTHAQAYWDHTAEYTTKVKSFVSQYIN
ncbi:MAG: Alpha/beta hydrolase family protein [Bacteroidetes bacterium]|nr:Alpha/beta hydrolase family protein [Bacteroidota bacterium]